MNRYWNYLLALLILVMAVFMGFYYLSNGGIFMENNDDQEIVQDDPESEGQNSETVEASKIELNPGEEEFRLDGIVTSINRSSNPVEITVTPFFSEDRLSAIPASIEERKVLVTDETGIVKGIPFETETEIIGIDEIREGDRLIIRISESILNIAEVEEFTAISIRKVVLD